MFDAGVDGYLVKGSPVTAIIASIHVRAPCGRLAIAPRRVKLVSSLGGSARRESSACARAALSSSSASSGSSAPAPAGPESSRSARRSPRSSVAPRLAALPLSVWTLNATASASPAATAARRACRRGAYRARTRPAACGGDPRCRPVPARATDRRSPGRARCPRGEPPGGRRPRPEGCRFTTTAGRCIDAGMDDHLTTDARATGSRPPDRRHRPRPAARAGPVARR